VIVSSEENVVKYFHMTYSYSIATHTRRTPCNVEFDFKFDDCLTSNAMKTMMREVRMSCGESSLAKLTNVSGELHSAFLSFALDGYKESVQHLREHQKGTEHLQQLLQFWK